MIEAEELAVCPIVLRLEPVELVDRGEFPMHMRAIEVIYFRFRWLFVLLIGAILVLSHFVNVFYVKVYLILAQFDVFII